MGSKSISCGKIGILYLFSDLVVFFTEKEKLINDITHPLLDILVENPKMR